MQHQPLIRPKQKLLYLAEITGLPVQFTDIPKVISLTFSKTCNMFLGAFDVNNVNTFQHNCIMTTYVSGGV